MNFIWSTLRVKDLNESIEFYTKVLELEIVNRFKTGHGTEIVFLGKGETQIELIFDESKSDIDAGKDISWGFLVDSLDKTTEALNEKGINILSGPIQPNPHIKFIYINDPNGMKIQLVEKIQSN